MRSEFKLLAICAITLSTVMGCGAQIEQSGPVEAADVVSQENAPKINEIKSNPRAAVRGEPSVGNWSRYDLTFEHLAEDATSHFDGRCTAPEIIEATGWKGLENVVVEKEVDYFVACNK